MGLPLVLWCQFKVSHPVSVLCDFGMPFDFLPLTHSSQPYTTLQLSLIRPLWQRRHAHPIVLSRALSDWMYQNWVFTVAREKSLNTVHFRAKAGSLCRVSNFLTQSVTAHLPPHCTHDLPITTSLLTEKLGHIIFISAGTRAAMLFTTTPLVDNDQIECEGGKKSIPLQHTAKFWHVITMPGVKRLWFQTGRLKWSPSCQSFSTVSWNLTCLGAAGLTAETTKTSYNPGKPLTTNKRQWAGSGFSIVEPSVGAGQCCANSYGCFWGPWHSEGLTVILRDRFARIWKLFRRTQVSGTH